MEETVPKVKGAADVEIVGLMVSLDRCEKGLGGEKRALEEIKEKYPRETVLLVCHGGVCRNIRTYFEDMTNEEYFHYSEENAAFREYSL